MCMGRGCAIQDEPPSGGTFPIATATASSAAHSATPDTHMPSVPTAPHTTARIVVAFRRTNRHASASSSNIASSAAGKVYAAGQAMSLSVNASKKTDSARGGRSVGAFANAVSTASALSPCCWMLPASALATLSSGVW